MALSRGRKILYGCLILIGAVVVFVVVVGVLFVNWLQTPTEPLESLRLVDADTGIYLELSLDDSNPGARDMVRELFSVQQSLQRSQTKLPPFMDWMNDIDQRQLSDEDIDELLPITAVVSRQTGGDDETGGASFVVDLPSAGHGLQIFDRIFSFTARRNPDMRYTEHLAEAYYRLPDDDGEFALWMAVIDTHLAFALAEAPVRSVVERMARTPAQRDDGGYSPLMPLLDAHPPASVLRLAAVDSTGPLLAMIERPFPGLATLLARLLGDSRSVSGWLELESAGTLVGELHADTGLSAAESPGAPVIGDVIRLDLQGGRMSVTLEPIRAEQVGWSAWRLRLDGLLEAFRHGLGEALDEENRRDRRR